MSRLALCLLLLAQPAPASASAGVSSLTVEAAVAAGIPLTFSPATAFAALQARHAATLPPPGALQQRASLQPHLPALRQVAQLCASAAALGLHDSAPLWAVLLGLAEAQAAAQARLQQLQLQQQQQQQSGAPLPQLPRAWLHLARWAGGAGAEEAPPALLQPLGRALSVDIVEGAAGEGPWELLAGSGGAARVDFLLLDGARSHEAVLRDLLALAGRVGRYIGLPHSEYAPREGSEGGLPPLHTTGIKAAVFDFLYLHNNTGQWDVSAHFANNAGFTLLGRKPL